MAGLGSNNTYGIKSLRTAQLSPHNAYQLSKSLPTNIDATSRNKQRCPISQVSSGVPRDILDSLECKLVKDALGSSKRPGRFQCRVSRSKLRGKQNRYVSMNSAKCTHSGIRPHRLVQIADGVSHRVILLLLFS